MYLEERYTRMDSIPCTYPSQIHRRIGQEQCPWRQGSQEGGGGRGAVQVQREYPSCTLHEEAARRMRKIGVAGSFVALSLSSAVFPSASAQTVHERADAAAAAQVARTVSIPARVNSGAVGELDGLHGTPNPEAKRRLSRECTRYSWKSM
ncbi:hypothetical protein K438DRAFT_1782170 [Mycena galopus ATCC 62051]|nr:hypothetical protein K438DRAFT_1782170 [Mycena galopus ATCC 62051]